jgi:hypothetical protein
MRAMPGRIPWVFDVTRPSSTHVLTLHSFVGCEIMLRIRYELAIGWMIDRFNADDPRLERRVVFVRVPNELKFSGGRSDDEHALRVMQLARYLLEEVTQIVGMVVFRGCALGMSMDAMGRDFDHALFRRIVDVKKVRLMVIDPHNDAANGAHGCFV